MCGPYMGAVLYISQVYHTPAGVAIAAKMRYNIIYAAALCRFQRQHRIIPSTDAASEKYKLLSKKRR